MKRSVILNNSQFVILILMAISFVLPIAFNSIAVILLMLTFFADIKNMSSRFRSYLGNKSNLFLLMIFLALLISLLYSEDKQTGMKGILSALPLIAVPLSLAGLSGINEKKIQIIKKVFVAACILSSLVYLIIAVVRSGMFDGSYKSIHAPESYYPYFVSRLTYTQLTPSVHPIFFSLYMALAIFLIVFSIRGSSTRKNILYCFVIGYLLIYLLFLASIVINFAVYSFFAVYFYLVLPFRKWDHYLLFFGNILLGTATTVYIATIKYIGPDGDGTYRFNSPEINQKIFLAFIFAFLIATLCVVVKIIFKKKHIVFLSIIFLVLIIAAAIYIKNSQEYTISNLKGNNISVRFKYGKAALDVIKSHPFSGIGMGDKKNERIMKAEDLPPGAEPGHVFNSHNQFLDFWLAAGIIPLICFIIYLINVCRQAIKQKHIIYMALAYCFCLFCFTDAAMMVQRGQVFFLFFVCLFEFESKRKTEQVV